MFIIILKTNMAVVKGDNNFKAIEHNEERMTLVKEARNTVHFIWWYVPPEPPAPSDKRLEWDYRNKNVASLDELREYWYTYKKNVLGYPDRLYTLWIEDGWLSFDVPMNEKYWGSWMLWIPAYDNEFNKWFTSLPKKVCFSFWITPWWRYEEAPSGKYISLDYKLFDPQNWGSYASNLIGLTLTKYTWSNNFSLRLSHLVASKGSSTRLIDESNINNKSWYFNVYVEIDYVNSLATVKIWWDETHLDWDDSDTYPNWRYWYVYTHTFSEREKTAIATWLNAKVGTFTNFNHTICVSSNVDASLTKKWYFRYFKQSVEYRDNYTVRFLNYDNTVLQTLSCAEWTTPTYSWATPTKPPIDEDHFFTFDGWSPTLWPVTHDTDYVAQYKANYLVRFLNYDDTVLQSWSVAEWETPTYSWATPTKPSDEQYSYTFSWWSPEITTVSWDQTYTAQYTATPVTPAIMEWDYDFSNNSMTKDEIKALFNVTASGSDFNLTTDWIVPKNRSSSDSISLTTKNVSTGSWDTIQSIELWYEMESGSGWNNLTEILSKQNYMSHTNYASSYDWTWFFRPNISVSWATFTETTARYGGKHPSWWQIYIKIDSEWIYWEYKDTHYNHTLTYSYTAEVAQQFLEILKNNWGLQYLRIMPRGWASIKNFKYKVVVAQ